MVDQNYMTNRLIKEMVDKNQKDYVEEEEIEENNNENNNENNSSQEQNSAETTPTQYAFISFEDSEGQTKWGEGIVELTGITENGFTQVEVLENTPETSFIGEKFYISSEATVDKNFIYPLYVDAGETAAGIYVTIKTTQTEK